MRSVYHIEWRHQYNGCTCPALVQGTAIDNPIWKIFSKLNVLAKVKIFSDNTPWRDVSIT
jgi:hypothetical protein